MTVEKPDRETKPYLVTEDALYADDTMLVSRGPDALQTHLNLVVAVGDTYGLELNSGKHTIITYAYKRSLFAWAVKRRRETQRGTHAETR
eukprot:8415147-Pyramimonas_sp.AAC.1